MRMLTVCLVLLLALVHSELWLGKGAVPRVMQMQSQLEQLRSSNEAQLKRNAQMRAEVSDLKEGLEMVEEKARFDLGMLKPNEIMIQLVPVPR